MNPVRLLISLILVLQVKYTSAQVKVYEGEDTHVLKAKELMNEHNYREAIIHLDYYQGCALIKLGKKEEALETFNRLERRGKRLLLAHETGSGIGINEGGSARNMKSASDAYYLQGLAYLGKGDHGRAKEMFAEAVKNYPYHLWANYYLANGNP